jgi:hypothetical protein
MKRVIYNFLFLGLLLATITPSIGQEISIGAKVGYSSAGLNKSVAGKKSVNGPLVGGIISVEFTKSFSLQVEGNYQLKGGGYGFKYGGKNYFDYFKFKVLEFPLLAKFTMGESKVKFIALIGPYVGYTLNIERRFEDPSKGLNETTRYDNFTFFNEEGIKSNRLDIGFAVGTGFSVEIGKGKMFMEARYTPSLTKWFDLEFVNYTTINIKDLSHRAVSINAGYTMPIWSRIK